MSYNQQQGFIPLKQLNVEPKDEQMINDPTPVTTASNSAGTSATGTVGYAETGPNLAQPPPASYYSSHPGPLRVLVRNQDSTSLYRQQYESPFSPVSIHTQEDNHTGSVGQSRSVRSLFSSKSGRRSGEMLREPTNPYSHVGYEDDKKLLPIVEADSGEDDDDDDDDDEHELLPDIKQVLESTEDINQDPEREASKEVSTSHKKRRGHHNLIHSNKAKKRNSKLVKALRNIYVKLLSRTLFTRSLVYWFPLALVLFVPLAIGAWAAPNATLGNTKIQWIFIWLEIVWGSLWLARFTARIAPLLYIFFAGIIVPSWKKYATILQAMEMALTLVLWALVSMITFLPIMTQNPHATTGNITTQSWETVVNNILVSLLISSLVYFAERLLIHFISVSFHKTRFQKRIKNNKLAIRVLAQLLKASYSVFPPFCPEFATLDMHLQSGAILARGSKNVPTSFAKKLASNTNIQKAFGNINRVVGNTANVIGAVGKEMGGRHQSSTYHTVVDGLSNKYAAETLAKRLWLSLVLEDSEELVMDDIIDVLGEENKQEAEIVFNTLDSDGNGDLTLEEMIASVQEIAKERKTIYRSLRDVDSAIEKLHSVLLVVVGLIMIIIFIGMLAPSVSAVLATLGTSLLGLSFIFSVTCQEILASCVFLFVKHPIDVGDTCEIITPRGVTRLVVLEMSLLFTVFKMSTGEVTQAPNAVLNTLWIDNISRSEQMSAAFNLILGLPETTLEQLELLKARIVDFLKENSRDYMPDPWYQVSDFPDLDRITLTVSITFKSNAEDNTLYGIRKTKFIQFLGQCIHEIPLHVPRRTETYSEPSLPFRLSASGLQVAGDQNNNDLHQSREISNRLPMGFRPREQVFDVDQEEQVDVNEKVDMTDTATSTGVQRLNTLKSQFSTMSRTKTTTGRRRRNTNVTPGPLYRFNTNNSIQPEKGLDLKKME